jgi:hypothetical protein
VPGWKLDLVYCVSLSRGIAGLSGRTRGLGELLAALESLLASMGGTIVTEEAHHGIADVARKK